MENCPRCDSRIEGKTAKCPICDMEFPQSPPSGVVLDTDELAKQNWGTAFRESWGYILLVFFATSWLAYWAYNTPVTTLTLVVLPFTLLVGFISLVRLLGSSHKAYSVKLERATLLIACICFAAIQFWLLNTSTRRLEERTAPAIAALEKYKADNGNYPDRLEALTPKYLQSLPECKMLLSKMWYQKLDEEKGYRLICKTGVEWGYYAYDSNLKQWKNSHRLPQ